MYVLNNALAEQARMNSPDWRGTGISLVMEDGGTTTGAPGRRGDTASRAHSNIRGLVNQATPIGRDGHDRPPRLIAGWQECGKFAQAAG
jgi:hypothetical protein